MSKLAILASVFALAVGTTGCGNSQGQSNSLVDVGPSTVSSTSSQESGGNLATLAKGGRNTGGTTTTGGGTIDIVLLDSTDGVPHFSQHVTFNVSTTDTQYPWVEANCYQNGTQVYHQANALFKGSLETIFTLGPTGAWTSGGANCTATLQNRDSYARNGHIIPITSMSFVVYP